VIPGGDAKTRYVFQVVEWNAAARRWVVSHAAHGDEQLCHLLVEDDARDPARLRLFFSDAETKCEGALDAAGAIAGKVSQLVRPEEAFEHASTANDVFRLEPAVGACFTPMVEARVARLTRWKLAEKVMPGVFDALDAAQRAAGAAAAFGPAPADALVDRLRATRLVSAPPLARETLAALATAPGEAPGAPGSAPAFDAYTEAYRDTFGFQRADDFAAGGDAACAFDDDDVETVDAGAECDERAEIFVSETTTGIQTNAGVATRSGRVASGAGVSRAGPPGPGRTPYKSTLGRPGSLEVLRMTPAERDWWRLWRTAQFDAEAECCAMRERARRLQAEIFATRSAKRVRVKQEMSRGPLGGRRAAHARAHVLLSRQHQLLLRALNASDMPPNVLNEVVSAQARALKQSEFRLHVAYQLFDEALRGFEARLPRESVERRSAVVPPGGLAAMAGAIPGFDVDEKNVKEAKETTCPICAEPIAPGQTLCALDCGHLFHPACIQDWVHSNPSCPMCRETVLERVRGDPEDEPEPESAPESDAEGEGEPPREADESEESGAGAGARFPGAPPGFVPAAVFESMMRAMAGRGGAGQRFPGADASSPDESFESGDEDDLGGEDSEDSDDLVLGMTNAEARRILRRSTRSARSADTEGRAALGALGGGRADDEMDEDHPAMPRDDALPALVDSSDDEDVPLEDVPLEDVPDLVDSSDDDAALETSMNVD